jgi:monovalent cation/proton antiporter MnhG/PhaG subunit
VSSASIAVEVALAVGIFTALLCCLGVAVMKNPYERMHFMAPVSTVSAAAVLIALVIQEGWGQAVIKMSLILLVLFLTNAVLAHATARAARVRELGHWQPVEGENIEGLEQIAGRRHKGK